jgi:hypothetical protein
MWSDGKKDGKGTMTHADARIEAGVWEESESGNPAGRPKGARNQLSESVLEELISHWEDNGRDAIQLTCKD